MKITKSFILLALVTIFLSTTASKCTVNHKGRNIEISQESLQDHLDHGDTCVDCIVPA